MNTCETCKCAQAFVATLRSVADQAKRTSPDADWPKGDGGAALWAIRQSGIATTLNRMADKIEHQPKDAGQ